jgi:hypothetical protein
MEVGPNELESFSNYLACIEHEDDSLFHVRDPDGHELWFARPLGQVGQGMLDALHSQQL